VTSSWFFLSTLNYDARSTTHQIYKTMKSAKMKNRGNMHCLEESFQQNCECIINKRNTHEHRQNCIYHSDRRERL